MKTSWASSCAFTGALLVVALLAGCQGTTPIKTLLDDPARFDKSTVRIAGVVSHGVGVLGYGTFMVDDGTGRLRVVTKEGGSPRDGAKVGVEGEFRQGFTLGTETAAVLIEKQRFTSDEGK